jgi:hypothetical protein
MSFWLFKRNADGRQEIWQIDIDLMSVVFVIGILAALVAPRWMRGPVAVAQDGLVLAGIGILFLVIAKVSLFRRGIWVSCGPRRMGKCAARLYKCAYVLLVLGAGLALLAYGAR